MQIFTVKSLAIFFGLATIAFTVSTIVLAVQKAELQDELDDALNKLDSQSTTTTTSTTTTVAPGKTTPGTGETTEGSGASSTTTGTINTEPTDPTAIVTNDGTTEFTYPWPTLTDPTPTTPSTPKPDFPLPEEIIYRLPRHARAYRYQIYLKPNLPARTFEGTVSIGIAIDELTNVIALHSRNLDIFGVTMLQVMVKMRIRIKAYYTDPVRQLLIIEFAEVLQLSTPYTLSISFRGNLTGLSGFYSTSYTDDIGEEK